jgi:hypothetical protein
MASNFPCAPDDEVSQHHLRYSDMIEEPRKMLLPIEGYEKMPLVPLTEAVKPLTSIIPGIDHKAWVARQNSDDPAEGLTPDESASIMLYSMEGQPREMNVYFVLNSTLRSNKSDRIDKLKPWFLYLKLFITALTRLPSQVRTVYRGVKMDLSASYPDDKTFVWWGFSSCTSSMKTLKSEQFLGQTGVRTLFAIECFSGKDIRRHSYYPSEDEILLIAARQFVVVACLSQPPDLHIVQVKEVEPTFPHLKLETNNLSLSTLTLNPAQTKSMANEVKPYVSLFLCEAYKHLGLRQNWEKDEKQRRMVVKAAAQGIIEEGTTLDKMSEAKKLANSLLEHSDDTAEGIWKCCVCLYGLENFLYKKLIEYMRLVDKEDKENKDVWHSKVPTLGPFALLLNLGFIFGASTHTAVFYRGQTLTADQMDKYRADVGNELTFQAFTSVTRNRAYAEHFGNVLFIINGCNQHMDMSTISQYPDEVEELLPAGLRCRIDRVIFDSNKNKHLIYLTVLNSQK